MFRLVLARLLFALVPLVCAAGAPVHAQLFETRAQQAYLVDADTGTVLFAKNENDLVPPASLAKLMTMEVVFNAIKTGRLTLEDTFQVSENAWRTGGAASRTSTMFAELKSSIPLVDLIQGVIVQSANDGCIIIAEGMAGSEDNFARLMTERARDIGLTRSVFGNSSGLPHPDSKVSMKDLVTLARHVQTTYPEFYRYYSQRDFTWNNILQRNRNPLLGLDIGVDGLKTGYTEESGYAIVASINREGRRLFLAMGGMSSERERAEESRKMLEWGIRAFERKSLFAKDETIGELSVYGGAGQAIVKARDNIDIFLPITNPDRLSARITYRWPLRAPLDAGTQVGVLKVYIGDTLSQETPLYVTETVDKGPLHTQALDALLELAQFWL
ncbi:D-alanyl-D-alanine carboxypeptidase family protein [Hoeflea ulvae]|uniref:serine-type D-Ala-D-Ala carboxypeptidase n=1 Tax=Hoeflea ulvae TaxID=2983764 RepID=A0ABT3YGP2_9HYPH|nr:D-alanyl-D-alanine carboxypeptidase family protein [Hoeflea ulvae]MCY0094977.1 D-alanyl-D-alanine carboxypeptidase [Hoeflea ulvae]